MSKKKSRSLFALNGMSIHSLSVDQGGDLEVEFDLPQDQITDLWYTYKRGSRTFDVYDDDELEDACRRLFRVVRDRMQRADPERAKVHCDRCEGSPCCRKYNVLTTPDDLERLSLGLGLNVNDLERDYTTDAVDWCGDYRRQLRCDDDEEGKEKCVFLEPNDEGLFRCTVYDHRPQICREFDMKTCDDFVPVEQIKVIT